MEHQELACSINQSKTYADCQSMSTRARLRRRDMHVSLAPSLHVNTFLSYTVMILGYSMNKQFNLAREGVTGVFRPDSNSFEPKAKVKTYPPIYRN